ncbi:hypothetical protein DQ400_19880 [Vreelandella sulfidaeris]|jgi:uncharacterized protein with ParB-like and HNH nuclease domain|uniref:GmrSD restriction endonucleases N-terminal domain-containing protein n=1 Tax=Vreelandella sulfidaeris TaxID=115553 RepID=A0A365TII9_9GAMM|nr:DUF262 domain-containing protein [Halomonas sulfidaeris]RBI64971.1 hypothetical protein DQ400_19880 [Halomonas sulfidaeris]|tara:strand:- start:2847 stop:3338 length:492 start_codon:yes stop_codon:yes gene_type:complete
MTATAPLEKGILSVRELLGDGSLDIPVYQRPYKWTTKNISQLFADITLHKDKTAYRLGTVVFHKEEDDNGKIRRNIVDGQQRTLSLMLAVRALISERTGLDADNPITRKDLLETLETLGKNMKDPHFSGCSGSLGSHRKNVFETKDKVQSRKRGSRQAFPKAC